MDFEDRDTGRYVKAVEARFQLIETAYKQLEKSIQEHWRRDENRQRMDHFQNQRDIIRDTHERGQAYTNVILTVGYAGFFGLWAITKEYPWPRLQAIALLCIAVSLACFVSWELLQAAVRSALPDEPEHLTIDQAPKKRWYARSNIIKVWAWFFIPAVVTGLAAATLLMSILIAHATEVFRTAPTPVSPALPTPAASTSAVPTPGGSRPVTSARSPRP